MAHNVLHQAAAATLAVARLQSIGCEVLGTRASVLNHYAHVTIARAEPLLAWLDAQPESERPFPLAGTGILLHECVVSWAHGPAAAEGAR